MRLPPVGLVAPTLCPRCDTPTASEEGQHVDRCPGCGLQLRWCGNCRGVASPFDRYCGFCGFELVRGSRRSPLWRAWLLVALVPLVAGLGYGVWSAHLLDLVLRPTSTPPPPAISAGHRSPGLGLRYAAPFGWTVIDYSSGPGQALPLVVMSRNPLDQSAAVQGGGDLTRVGRPRSTIVSLTRTVPQRSLVGETTDPAAVLSAELAPLVEAPPAGTGVHVLQPVHALTVGGRPAAEVLLQVDRGGERYYLARTLVYAPGPGGPMLRVDAVVPAGEWEMTQNTITAIVRSLAFA
jgi:predicted RNA-binding Zn-ribbon protein involved in translation (DUF1610 family)